jgi:DNA processing protein
MVVQTFTRQSIFIPGEGAVEVYTDGPLPISPREHAVAIVGARSCSHEGLSYARRLACALSADGFTVVSGLARGIDTATHRGALEGLDHDGDGGSTIAVLGCGIDRVYPAANADVDRHIRKQGLVLSEYGPGTEPAPWRFLARNRIIAALCTHVIVVEARERSGALITADFAREFGATVWAVPGALTSVTAAGCNDLIRNGHARMVPRLIEEFVEALNEGRN